MTAESNLPEVLQEVMEDLLKATDASRTTVRLDMPAQNLVLEKVAAEATACGVRPLKGDKSIKDLRNAVPPVRFVEENLQILVQEDCLTADLAPPSELIEHYGVKAQMLAPVVENGHLIGIISVHYTPEPRHWSEKDIVALQDAAERIERELRIN